MLDHEKRINQWRTTILASQKLPPEVADELEDHLRAELDDLGKLNIAEDEQFMLARHRMGDITVLENEFGKLDHHKRWLMQLIVMLGGYILLTLLFQLVQVIAVTIGSAKVLTEISQPLGAQVYSISSMMLLALFSYGVWKLAQKRSPTWLIGYRQVHDGSLRKLVQNTFGIGLIVMGARMLDTIVSRQLNNRTELFLFREIGDSPIGIMETMNSFYYTKSIYDGAVLPILFTLIIVVLMLLIRRETSLPTPIN